MRPRTRRAAMTLAGLRTLLAAEGEDLLYVAAPVTERGLGYGSDSVGRLALIALVPLCVFSDGRGGRSTIDHSSRVAPGPVKPRGVHAASRLRTAAERIKAPGQGENC